MEINIPELSEEIKSIEEMVGVCYGPPALAPGVKMELLRLKVELFKCKQLEAIQGNLHAIEVYIRRDHG